MHDDSRAYTGLCLGQSLNLSLQYTAGGVLAVLDAWLRVLQMEPNAKCTKNVHQNGH